MHLIEFNVPQNMMRIIRYNTKYNTNELFNGILFATYTFGAICIVFSLLGGKLPGTAPMPAPVREPRSRTGAGRGAVPKYSD